MNKGNDILASALKEKIVQTLTQLPKVRYDLDWNDI
jgi:hypothetical protein